MPTYITKAELAEAKQKLDKRITALVATVVALGALVAGLTAWQVDATSQISDLQTRLAALEGPPVDPEEPPVEGEVLFRDDFNSIPAAHKSAGGWYSQCNTGRMSVVNGAVRMEVRTGENETDTGNPRCELSGGPSELREGQSYWIYDRLRVGSDDSGNPSWELWDQWHDGGPTGSQYSPSVALFRYGADVRFINGKGSPVYWSGKAVERGTWHTLLYHYVLSTGSSGLVESWWDGVQQPTFTGKTSNTGQAYLKIGINSSNSRTGTSVVEHDRLVVATTKAAALAE